MLDILYEDNHLIAINKTPGLLVQGDKTGDEPLAELVKDYLRVTYNKPGNIFAGVIHRLDRPVSGVILLAKTSKALERMNAQFRDKEVQKTYWAIVNNMPPQAEDQIEHWLVKNERTNTTKASTTVVKGGLHASLTYRLLENLQDDFLLEVLPHTGRPHQIRSQLSAIKCPIKGDSKYGSTRQQLDGAIALHAAKIAFTHPVKKEPIEIKAGLPDNKLWNPFKGRRN